jgi:hypothetical protein
MMTVARVTRFRDAQGALFMLCFSGIAFRDIQWRTSLANYVRFTFLVNFYGGSGNCPMPNVNKIRGSQIAATAEYLQF